MAIGKHFYKVSCGRDYAGDFWEVDTQWGNRLVEIFRNPKDMMAFLDRDGVRVVETRGCNLKELDEFKLHTSGLHRYGNWEVGDLKAGKRQLTFRNEKVARCIIDVLKENFPNEAARGRKPFYFEHNLVKPLSAAEERKLFPAWRAGKCVGLED